MTSSGFGPLIDTLSPEQVKTFLLKKGWTQRAYKNPDLLVFKAPAPHAEKLTLVLPADQEFADFPSKLRDVVRTLAVLYKTDSLSVVHQIAHWDRDVIRVRLESPRQKEQLLPLSFASDMINQYRKFVAFAATTQAHPRRFFAAMTSAGLRFADNCLFGHTFAGSFGLTIECPLDIDGQQVTDEALRPHPSRRAVTERIATAYTDMALATREDNPDIIVRNQAAGFSGNMCDILVKIYEMSEGRSISQRIAWAPEIRPPDRLLAAEQPVVLDSRCTEVLRSASKALHTVDEPDVDKTIIGRVTTLRSEVPPVKVAELDDATHTIYVLWEFEPSQVLHLRIDLPVEQYIQALNAHASGRSVRVRGKPRKEGSGWWLRDYHDFGLA